MKRWLKISFLLFFVALCGVAVVVTERSREPAPARGERELFAVVNSQLTDLRAANFDRAYRYAAAGVQQKFSRAQFELMIERDFPLLMRAEHVEFGAVRVSGGQALAQVFLSSPDGSVRAYLYSFTVEKDGWKIDGVQPLGPHRQRRVPGLRG